MGDSDIDRLHPFPSTHWSLVGRAGSGDRVERGEALSALLRRYMPALRSHLVVGKRVPDHRADDLLQGYLLSKVLEKELLSRADRKKGRFRTYLLTTLDRYTIDEVRRERSAKRSPDQTPLLVDEIDPAAADAPLSEAFDLGWAEQIMAESGRRMEAHCQGIGRNDIWGIFEARLFGPMLRGGEPLAYERLIEQFTLASPADAFNLLNSAKRMFLRTVRGVIAEYEKDEDEIDAEMNDLRKILSRRRA